MPAAVLHQARHALHTLETRAALAHAQVDLFAAPPQAVLADENAVEVALAAIHPDAMSPREALDALYSLKKLALRA